MKRFLTFNDVVLMPQFSTIKSRKEVTLSGILSSNLSDIDIPYDIPVASSNMDTITDYDMAMEMLRLGCIPFLHRNLSIIDNVTLYEDVIGDFKSDGNLFPNSLFVTIGVGEKEFQRFIELHKVGCRSFCIDVAHGHCSAVRDMTFRIREATQKEEDAIFLVAGNIATEQAAFDYYKWGIDMAKVGIGSGSVCTTRVKTGVGVPQISAVMDCSKYLPVIADGGIRTPADAAKAIAAGASLIMLGGMISGTDETPGLITIDNGKDYKAFRGMSSFEVNSELHDGEMPDYKTPEGISTKVQCKGPVSNIIKDIAGGLRSTCSYLGVQNISDLSSVAEFAEVTTEGYIEGTPHISPICDT